jgi:hypothetical protein
MALDPAADAVHIDVLRAVRAHQVVRVDSDAYQSYRRDKPANAGNVSRIVGALSEHAPPLIRIGPRVRDGARLWLPTPAGRRELDRLDRT